MQQGYYNYQQPEEHKPKNKVLAKIFHICSEILDRVFWLILGTILGALIVIVITFFMNR